MKNKRKGFSVAEATIALLIGSIALGMAAPMITKQIKYNNMSEVQTRVLTQRMEDNQSSLNDLIERVSELERWREEADDKNVIPSGTIAFFNRTTCPEFGWQEVPATWANHFLMIKRSTDKTRALATLELDSIPNITGTANVGHHTDNKTPETGTDGNAFYFGGGNKHKGPDATDSNNQLLYFDAKRVAEVYGRLGHGDLRPKNIALIACVKVDEE